MSGPRFEQTAHAFQPAPLSAIELIAEQPIRLVNARSAVCDGGQCRANEAGSEQVRER